MDRVPSASGLTIVSQEGDGPILLVVLYCRPYGRVNTVNVLKEALVVCFLVDDKGVIHIPVPEPGGWGQCLELFVLSTPCRDWQNGADWGTHGSTLNLFIELVLERNVGVLETKLQQEDNVTNFHNSSYLEGVVLFQKILDDSKGRIYWD